MKCSKQIYTHIIYNRRVYFETPYGALSNAHPPKHSVISRETTREWCVTWISTGSTGIERSDWCWKISITMKIKKIILRNMNKQEKGLTNSLFCSFFVVVVVLLSLSLSLWTIPHRRRCHCRRHRRCCHHVHVRISFGNYTGNVVGFIKHVYITLFLDNGLNIVENWWWYCHCSSCCHFLRLLCEWSNLNAFSKLVTNVTK